MRHTRKFRCVAFGMWPHFNYGLHTKLCRSSRRFIWYMRNRRNET